MAHIANSTSSTSSPCSGWHGNLLPQPPMSGARGGGLLSGELKYNMAHVTSELIPELSAKMPARMIARWIVQREPRKRALRLGLRFPSRRKHGRRARAGELHGATGSAIQVPGGHF